MAQPKEEAFRGTLEHYLGDFYVGLAGVPIRASIGRETAASGGDGSKGRSVSLRRSIRNIGDYSRTHAMHWHQTGTLPSTP